MPQWPGKILSRRNKIRLKLRDILILSPDVHHFLQELCNTFETSYVRGGIAASRESTFREGQQSIGHELMNIVNMGSAEMMSMHFQETQSNTEDRDTNQGAIDDD